MCTNWKRFTFRAFMLASLTLILFGCGGGGGAPQAPPSKAISGTASDPATGLPIANATVSAYAIDGTGTVATTPLSAPETTKSDGQGNYTIKVPAAYSGGVMIVATLPDGRKVRSVIPFVTAGEATLAPVMVSLATEMVTQYIHVNNGGKYTPANVQTAELIMEQYFGPNFSRIPPPTPGAATTPLQQNLITVTQAINVLTTTGTNGNPPYTIDQLVTATGGNIAMGQDPALTDLNSAITLVTTSLINNGTLPGTYVPPVIDPTPVPTPGDTLPPFPPTNLVKTTVTSNSVSLSWTAATDQQAAGQTPSGVTSYYVYRDGIFIATVSAPAVTFTDSGLAPATTYTYVVTARDAAGNVSAGSNQLSVTTPAIATHTISGTITVGGTGLGNVFVMISGAGSGIAITDATGKFSFAGAQAGTYTVTPSLTGFLFTPASRTVSVTNADVTGVDFTTTIPSGAVSGGIVYPDGVVIGGITYPPGTIVGGITYPTGVIIGGVTYPTATVIGGVTYPSGTVIGGITYPNGVVVGGIVYPDGTVIGGTIYPSGTVIGGIAFPQGSLSGQATYPTGSVIGGLLSPSGAITGSNSYPAGSITGTLTWQ